MQLTCALLFAGTAMALSLSTSAQEARAETWTRFRGPNGSGVAEVRHLPVEIGPEKGVLWRTALPPGHSSPVLSERHVFLTAFEDAALRTYCLDRADGAIVWRADVPGTGKPAVDRRNNAASPSPAVDAEMIAVFFPDVGLLGYDHAGKELWRVPLGPFNNVYGMGASPIVVGDLVLLACDQTLGSYFLAVDKRTGEERWRAARPWAKSGHCTPIVIDGADGKPEVILPGSFYLDAYDPANGARKWWVGGLSFEMKSVPVLSHGLLFINGYGSPLNQPGNQVVLPSFAEVLGTNDADGDGFIQQAEMPASRAASWFEFVDLELDGKLGEADWTFLTQALASKNGILGIRPAAADATGDLTATNVAWSYHRSAPQLPSGLVYQDVLYMVDDSGGLLTTFDPTTGDVIERGRLDKAVDNYYASPVAGADKVYLFSENGYVTVLPAGGSLEPLWTTRFDERIYATPALAEGRIFLRTDQALYCFGSK